MISEMVPFSARMVTERLVCGGHSSGSGISQDEQKDGMQKKRKGTYVRILVNDGLQSLDFCGADNDQLCLLDKFVDSQVYAKRNGDGDFEKCFE